MGIATHNNLMQGIRHAVEFVLGATDMPASTVKQAGEQVSQRLACVWINCVVHIPQGIKYRAMLRNKEIFDKFTGNNHAELAHEFGFSIQHIYQVIRAERCSYIRERQTDMFMKNLDENEMDANAFIQAKLFILADIMDHSSAVLCECLRMDKPQADAYGEQIASWMSENWGGQSAYIKSGKNKLPHSTQQELFK